ncbi:hypothetical protein GETHLI_02380 [Geothrix limicola]|uniref:histidine kinase n=1 Tax=Geothrix limicola TaxID=2927978 RepID=A0ABQ5QBC1_9BACT|nr:hybrid sensor histidine kinase/response regulator [Geothrix limicola]GLH71736.1 hypothetical protein GETHLI_02380 [Geothrix limicola]
MNDLRPQHDILVIDDNPSNLGVLSDLLRDQGYRVRVAQSGHRGLEAAQIAKPDLILLDITMPDMDGFEVCTRLKADPELAAIPVVFLSAHEGTLEKLKAFESGGADYVQKPFQVQEVLMRVRLQLRLASLQGELQAKNQDLEASNNSLREQAELVHHALFEAKALNRELIGLNEKLRQSEEIQSRFLARMRHEINNPLSAIIALADQALQAAFSPEQIHSACARIKAEASYLDFQIRNLFAAADLEAGAVQPSVTQVDVGSVLRNVMEAFSHEAQAKALTVRLEGGSGPTPLVFGTDAAMLRIITANLLANAIEYSSEGQTIRLRAALEEATLRLEIEDEGIGIRPEDRSRIFDRFKQLEEGPTRAHRGQGLGLPVTKALVDLLNGTIDVGGEVGKGAVFTCRLPRFTAMDETSTSSFEGNMFIFESPEEL